ncbi:MAG: universal stress protein [Miltoncostaeaceae bacterium]
MGAPYDHVAVCVSGGPADERVVAHAADLRDATSAERLSVVHVADVPPAVLTDPTLAGTGYGMSPVDPQPFMEGSRRLVEAIAAPLAGATPVLIDGGHPASAVCEWAAGAGCDLLVAGSHRGLWERVTLGSFASHLAHHAPCSILLVRPAG